jgi:hypothetical protein
MTFHFYRAWLLVTFLCKSLVFGFANADSFRYFDNLYNPQIKFISEYLRPMVIVWLSIAKDPIKFRSFSAEIFPLAICLRFCITLATIVVWHANDCNLHLIRLSRVPENLPKAWGLRPRGCETLLHHSFIRSFSSAPSSHQATAGFHNELYWSTAIRTCPSSKSYCSLWQIVRTHFGEPAL